MIIKSMGRRSTTARNGQSLFASLLNYFLSEKGAKIDLRHNLPYDAHRADIIDTFVDNARYLQARKNGNSAYHEILSLPVIQGDREKLKSALRDIGRIYLEERAPENIAVGVVHETRDHVHLHVMLSSNKLLDRSRVRLSKGDFLAVQAQVVSKAQALYPELNLDNLYTPDRVHANTRETVRLTQGQQHEKIHNKAPVKKINRKEELSHLLQGLFDKHQDKDALESALGHSGLALYQRGKSMGVVDQDGKKHRLATLGVMPSYQKWQQKIQEEVAKKETIQRELKAEAERAMTLLRQQEQIKKQQEVANKLKAQAQKSIDELTQKPPTQPSQKPNNPPKRDLKAEAEQRLVELQQEQTIKKQREQAEILKAQAQKQLEEQKKAEADRQAQAARQRAEIMKAQAQAQIDKLRRDKAVIPEPQKVTEPPKRDLKAEAERRMQEIRQEIAAKNQTIDRSEDAQNPRKTGQMPQQPTAPVQKPVQPPIPQKTSDKSMASPTPDSIREEVRRRAESIQKQKEAQSQRDSVSQRVQELNQARDQGRDKEEDAER